jgi:hypothetical protein
MSCLAGHRRDEMMEEWKREVQYNAIQAHRRQKREDTEAKNDLIFLQKLEYL